MALVLGSGAVSFLASRSRGACGLRSALVAEGFWPPLVPSPEFVESLQGDPGRDANASRQLKSGDVVTDIDEDVARSAAQTSTP